jgi:acetyl-CoA carboxylase carboxyltransferase component
MTWPQRQTGEPVEGPIPRLRSAAWSQATDGYRCITIAAGQHRFLKKVFDAFGCATLRIWTESSVSDAGFDRVCCDGLVTALGEFQGRTVAIVWSDFRVNAASFGRANSQRFAAFLWHLRHAPGEPVPLVYVVNSAGVSLMEGRIAFSDAFDLWPELLGYADEHLVLTCAVGKCLGLAPLLYGLGHYRVAVAGNTQVNLTGPEVIKLFFGQGIDFARSAAAERCVEHHDLVHELVPSVDAALARFKELLTRAPERDPAAAPSLGARTGALLMGFLDAAPLELIPGWCPRVRLFLGTRRGQPLGIFVNPLERSNNMITVRTLEKYAAGLDLFRAMRLPIVSLLDSPGMDPRFDQADANNVRKILWVGEKIIHYPHGAMGVVAGRCFGGATTLGFPKVFGGTRCIALRGCNIGLMHERIVGQVLSGSPRLLEQWEEVVAGQSPGYEDLLAQGTLDAVLDEAQLPDEIDRFLAHATALLPAARLVGARTSRPVRSLTLREQA